MRQKFIKDVRTIYYHRYLDGQIHLMACWTIRRGGRGRRRWGKRGRRRGGIRRDNRMIDIIINNQSHSFLNKLLYMAFIPSCLPVWVLANPISPIEIITKNISRPLMTGSSPLLTNPFHSDWMALGKRNKPISLCLWKDSTAIQETPNIWEINPASRPVYPTTLCI